jgi:hypothetical protein
MRRVWWLAVVVAVVMAVPAGGQTPVPATDGKTVSGTKPKVKKVLLGMRHRAHPDFYDETEAVPGKEFPVGDTEYSAKILRFEPDFFINDDKKIVSQSNEPRNPAFQIMAIEGGAPHDTSWAFMNFPPHFSKRALISFQVLRIDFENRAPVLNPNLKDPKAAGGKTP